MFSIVECSGPQAASQNYDYRVCKACRKSTGRPAIRLTSGWVYVCDDCGFHYLDYLDAIEHDTEGIRGAAYSEELRSYLESQLQSNKERFQHHLAILTECGSVEGKKVLDIGCGGGLFLSLARQAGAEVVGLELDDARAFHCTQVLGLDVVKHRIESEIQASASFVSWLHQVFTRWIA
jgi:2-polyprenyl-6-hydroxyphenyl methylase/3-demethylubiquinone-9 3-methyltransferase